MRSSREELIHALNSEFKKTEGLPDVEKYAPRFDASTGTMFCGEDKEYAVRMLEEAEYYFMNSYQMLKASAVSNEDRKKAEFCRIASEVIGIARKNKL